MGKKPEIRDWQELAPGYGRYRQLLLEADGGLSSRLTRGAMERVARFSQLASAFDLVLLDAYGVLNLGSHPIAGAGEALSAMSRAGVAHMVVSNNASQSPEGIVERLHRMGISITLDRLVTSGMVVSSWLPGSSWQGKRYLLMGTEESRRSYAPDPAHLEWRGEEGGRPDYLLLCSDREYWGGEQEKQVLAMLGQGVLPIVLANPDLAAPEEGGVIFPVAGYTSFKLWQKFGCPVTPLGKPFPPIFHLALQRSGMVGLDPRRVLMVGDTLDTDILGGAAMGFATCLCLSGVYSGQDDVEELCVQKGIYPDYMVESIAD